MCVPGKIIIPLWPSVCTYVVSGGGGCRKVMMKKRLLLAFGCDNIIHVEKMVIVYLGSFLRPFIFGSTFIFIMCTTSVSFLAAGLNSDDLVLILCSFQLSIHSRFLSHGQRQESSGK